MFEGAQRLVPWAVAIALTAVPSPSAAQRHVTLAKDHRHAPPRVGLVVRTLPRTHVRLTHRGGTLYYSSGVFYRKAARGFVVIARPLHARLAALPAGAVRIRIGGDVFYRHGHTFFLTVDGGYEVVSPPVGATVETLPWEYEAVSVGSEEVYLAGGIYYRFDPGRDTYVVVSPPGDPGEGPPPGR